MSSSFSNNGSDGQNGGGNSNNLGTGVSQNWMEISQSSLGNRPGVGVTGFQLEKSGEALTSSGNNRNYEHCINCRNPFFSDTGAVLRQCNTKLFLFKPTQTQELCFNNEVSCIPIVDAISYIFGKRFNANNILANEVNACGGEFEIPLCTGCADVVQRLYNLHKEFRELCHSDSHFQSLFKATTNSDNNTNGAECGEDESSDMIVPAVVYGGKYQEEDEEDEVGDGDDEVVFIPAADASGDDDQKSYSNTKAGRPRNNRKRKGKLTLRAPPKRQAVRKSPKPKKPEIPKPPPKKVKPKASLKSIVEKLKQKRLISKANLEFEVEQLEWKRRRFENSLHLFRIKQGKKANAAYIAGQDTVERLWKFPQGHPKMRANDVIPRVPCPDCGKTSNKRFLEVHRHVMHRKIPAFVCNKCGRQCRDVENLKLHLSTHPRKIRRIVLVKERRTDLCMLCGRTYRKSVLNLHLAIHGIPRRFNCKKCDSRFENSRDLKDHQVIHEEGGYYAFKCDSCTQGFKIESFLIQHHLVCEMRAVDRPFRCTFCEKRFKLKHHLESHLFEVHRLSKEESRGMVYPGLAKRTVNRKKK